MGIKGVCGALVMIILGSADVIWGWQGNLGLWSLSHYGDWASLVAQMVKNPSAMWETCIRSLHWEDPVEEGMDTHPSILA